MSSSPLTLHYELTAGQFAGCSRFVAMENVRAVRLRTSISGTVEAVIGLAMLLYGVVRGTQFLPYYLFSGMILCYGLYCLLFYNIFYPKGIYKSALARYEKSPYRGQQVTLVVEPGLIRETVGGQEDTFPWGEGARLVEQADAFYLMVSPKRAVVVPRDAGYDDRLRAALRQ